MFDGIVHRSRCIAFWGSAVSSRRYQTATHPQLFRHTVQLTDGSTIRLVSVTPNRPLVKLTVDAFCHPTWNPHLKDKLAFAEDGEVRRYKERFENVPDELDFTESFGDIFKKTLSTRGTAKEASPAKKAVKKK